MFNIKAYILFLFLKYIDYPEIKSNVYFVYFNPYFYPFKVVESVEEVKDFESAGSASGE